MVGAVGGNGGVKSNSMSDRMKALMQAIVCHELQKEIVRKDARIEELKLQLAEGQLARYGTTLVWKIHDFTLKRQEAISLQTPFLELTDIYIANTGRRKY